MQQTLRNCYRNLRPEQQGFIREVLSELQEGKTETLEYLWDVDYERKPPTIEEFLCDEYYLGGLIHGEEFDLHQKWHQVLEEIFSPLSPVVELILTGAIGIGKTTVAGIVSAYKIAQLCCMRDPAQFFGFMKGSHIVWGVFNITLARTETCYDTIRFYLDNSPFFKENYPRYTRKNDPIWIPSKRIQVIVGSLETHALGENLFGFILDEANFFTRTGEVKRTVARERSRAHRLYMQARTRMVQRFMRSGIIPGMCILLSQRRNRSDFLERHIEEVSEDPTTKVVSFAAWDITRKGETFSGYPEFDPKKCRHFNVLIGTEQYSSRILEEDEWVSPGAEVIAVPEEWRTEFERNERQGTLDEIIQSIAGRASVGVNKFIPNVEAIRECIDPTRQHPFSTVEAEKISVAGTKYIQDLIDVSQLVRVEMSRNRLRVDPDALRYAHVDLGESEDAAGLAIGHVSRTPAGEIVYYDILLRIVAPSGTVPGDVIDFDKIIEFFRFLSQHGMRFGKITYDRFQSTHSIAILKKLGFPADKLSVGYEQKRMLKAVIMSGRASFYYYEPVIVELSEEEEREGVIDHPPGGSDDVLEAMAGVAWHCGVVTTSVPMTRSKGEVLLPL